MGTRDPRLRANIVQGLTRKDLNTKVLDLDKGRLRITAADGIIAIPDPDTATAKDVALKINEILSRMKA